MTIDYVYDPLYRLKEANYSNGDHYHYTYDAVGNRLTQQVGLVTTNYVYDNANRLTSVDSVAYTWDNNGNLLNDGVNTYTYDSANRLISVSNQSTVSSYQYSGLGDRLSQTVNGNTTTYALDLNAGLTQVLNDGTNTYLYGVGRIAQVNTGTEYFLGDALGSVRQLTDASGEIALAKSYAPYGETLASVGNGSSPFAFTGEQQDVSGLTYLRARYYSSDDGRFITRDTWMGDYNSPLSLNRWMYVEGNPINYNDPSGFITESEGPEADQIVSELRSKNVIIEKDWYSIRWGYYWVDPIDGDQNGWRSNCEWKEGKWDLKELKLVRYTLDWINLAMKGNYSTLVGPITIRKVEETCGRGCTISGSQIELKDRNLPPTKSDMSSNIINASINFDAFTIAHEIGHAWDLQHNGDYHRELQRRTNGKTNFLLQFRSECKNDTLHRLPGCNAAGYEFGGIPLYGGNNDFNALEDFANSFAVHVFPVNAQQIIQQRYNSQSGEFADYYQYRQYYYWTLDQLRNNPRWIFVDELFNAKSRP